MKYRDGFKKGYLELIILHTLSMKDCYGYELCKLVEEWSKGTIVIQEGSLYPAFYKLEQRGWISSEKRLVGKRRERVYYHMEDAGREALKDMYVAYEEVTQGIQNILNVKE